MHKVISMMKENIKNKKNNVIFLGNNGYIFNSLKDLSKNKNYLFIDYKNLKKVLKVNEISYVFFLYGPNRHQCKKNFNFEYKRYIQVLNYVIKVLKKYDIWLFKLSTIHSIDNLDDSKYSYFYNLVDKKFLKTYTKSSVVYLGNIFGITSKFKKFKRINFIHKYISSYVRNSKFVVKKLDAKRSYTSIYFLSKKIDRLINSNITPEKKIVIKSKLISNESIINLIEKNINNKSFSKEFIFTILNIKLIYADDFNTHPSI